MVATRESATRANRLIAKACRNQGIRPGQLTLHQNHGTPTCLCLWHARRQVTAKSFSQLLIDPDILASYSKPRVSDDNPYSESQFKTLKYAPSYAGRFSDPQDARTYFQAFFPWYSTQHRHSGLEFCQARQLTLWPDTADAGRQTTGAQPRLSQAPRTIRQWKTLTTTRSGRSLDQPTQEYHRVPPLESVNSGEGCLILLTHSDHPFAVATEALSRSAAEYIINPSKRRLSLSRYRTS